MIMNFKSLATASFILFATASSAHLPSSNNTSNNATGQPGYAKCSSMMDGVLPFNTPSDFCFSGNVRRYYVAVDELSWDYIPSGWDNWLGVPLDVSPRAYQAGYTIASGSLGTKWTKALYRGYTDATFQNLTKQAPTQGIQGPLMRAEVGDLVEILVVNRLSKNFVSMHSMGLSYNKDNEGSLYPNVTNGSGLVGGGPNMIISTGDAIPPGGCFTYKWVVPDSSAPTNGAPSKFWAYHSYVNMPSDLNTGLIGPFIVYPAGKMKATMASNREFTLLYNNFDETNSWLAETNDKILNNGAGGSMSMGPMPKQGQGYGNYSVWYPQITNMPTTMLTAAQAPTFHALNGYSYANNPPFEMCVDDSVIWYVYAFGMASHVFHLHGNNFLTPEGQWMASHSLNDGNMVALNMVASSPGKWQLICHVSNHLTDGMVATYVVQDRSTCTLPKLKRDPSVSMTLQTDSKTC